MLLKCIQNLGVFKTAQRPVKVIQRAFRIDEKKWFLKVFKLFYLFVNGIYIQSAIFKKLLSVFIKMTFQRPLSWKAKNKRKEINWTFRIV